jgi:outer membrane protein assembly factor BamB
MKLADVALPLFALALASCGGAGGSRAAPVMPNRGALAGPAAAGGDDWVTFAHDQARSGFESAPTGIDRTTVATLKLRWSVNIREAVYASPIVTDGHVYVASDVGTVYAFDVADGRLAWKLNVGASIRSTPAAFDGLVFAAVYGVPVINGTPPRGASVVALDHLTGKTVWTAGPPNSGGVGLIRSDPVVLHGVVYQGLAGGDAYTGCVNGGIMTFNETSGTMVYPFWQTNAAPSGGGGVWSPLSTNGTNLFAGTGNLCGANEGTGFGDAAVSLNLALTPNWVLHTFDPSGSDEDVGSGVNVANRLAYVVGKNGLLYALEPGTGSIAWTYDFKPYRRGAGGIGTPTGDGTMIMASGGKMTAATPPGCTIGAFDLAGNPLYMLHSSNEVVGSAAFLPGIGFLGLDRALIAFDSRTGATLWTSGDLGDTMYASPAVVQSGVYAVTFGGKLMAFSPNAALPSSFRRVDTPRGNR